VPIQCRLVCTLTSLLSCGKRTAALCNGSPRLAADAGAGVWTPRTQAAGSGTGGAAAAGGSCGGSGGDSGPKSEEAAQAGGASQTPGYAGVAGQAGRESTRSAQADRDAGRAVQATAGGGGGVFFADALSRVGGFCCPGAGAVSAGPVNRFGGWALSTHRLK